MALLQSGLLAGQKEGHAAGRLAGLEEAAKIARNMESRNGAVMVVEEIEDKAQQIREGKG